MSVIVEENFVRVGGTSYAIDKITSVELRSDPEPANVKRGTYVILAAISALIAVNLPAFFVATAFFAWRAYRAHQNPPLQTHRLFLRLASQEATAWHSTDEAAVRDLQDRIEIAMARLSQRGANPVFGRVING